MRAFLTRSFTPCVVWDVLRPSPALCVRRGSYAQYTQEFALTRPLFEYLSTLFRTKLRDIQRNAQEDNQPRSQGLFGFGGGTRKGPGNEVGGQPAWKCDCWDFFRRLCTWFSGQNKRLAWTSDKRQGNDIFNFDIQAIFASAQNYIDHRQIRHFPWVTRPSKVKGAEKGLAWNARGWFWGKVTKSRELPTLPLAFVGDLTFPPESAVIAPYNQRAHKPKREQNHAINLCEAK